MPNTHHSGVMSGVDRGDSVRTVRLKPNAISDVCRQLGVSRERLAQRLGVSPTTTYRLDRQDSGPSNKFIAALLDVSGREFSDLFEIR